MTSTTKDRRLPGATTSSVAHTRASRWSVATRVAARSSAPAIASPSRTAMLDTVERSWYAASKKREVTRPAASSMNVPG